MTALLFGHRIGEQGHQRESPAVISTPVQKKRMLTCVANYDVLEEIRVRHLAYLYYYFSSLDFNLKGFWGFGVLGFWSFGDFYYLKYFFK